MWSSFPICTFLPITSYPKTFYTKSSVHNTHLQKTIAPQISILKYMNFHSLSRSNQGNAALTRATHNV